MKSRETEPQENRYIISGPPVQRMNRKEIEEQAAGILEKKYEEVLLPEIEEKLKPEAVIEELLQNGLTEKLDLAVTDLLKEKYEHQLVPEMQKYIKDNTASVMEELRGELKRRDYADTLPVKSEQGYTDAELEELIAKLLKDKYEEILEPGIERFIKDNKKFEMLMNYPPYMLQGLIEGIVTDKLRGRQPKMTARGRKASKDDDEDEGIEASETDIIIEELDEVEKKARKESPEVTMEEYERIVTSKKGILAIDNMGGEKFENFLKIYFQGQYSRVIGTPKTADYGADLLLTNRNGEMIVVQAKRHFSKITITTVYEVLGGMVYHGTQKGIIVTNNTFTKNAITLAKKGNVELWDRNSLIERITKDDLELIKKENEKFKDITALCTCPVCKEGILVRKINHDTDEEFYGCTRFEKGCRFTDDLYRTKAHLCLDVKKGRLCKICGKKMMLKKLKSEGWGIVCSSGEKHDFDSIINKLNGDNQKNQTYKHELKR